MNEPLMTKPAGCFSQAVGALLFLGGFGAMISDSPVGGAIALAAGVGLFWAGGASARAHARADRQTAAPNRSAQSDAPKQSNEPERIPCPVCAERIMPEAKKCRYCGAEIPSRDA